MKVLVALTLVALVGETCGKILTFSKDIAVFVTDQLQDIPEDDVGAYTDFLNCDKSSEHFGSIGDFETRRRCRGLEVEMNQCLIPCDNPITLECKSTQIHDITAMVVYTNCMSLSDADTNPLRGLYCKNANTRPKYGGGCKDNTTWKGEACREVLGPQCNCPDSECRRYCPGDKATRDAYAAQRMKEISTTRTLAVKALKDLVKERKESKRGLFKKTHVVRAALSQSFFKRALKDNENEELVLLSRLLLDDSIDWDN